MSKMKDVLISVKTVRHENGTAETVTFENKGRFGRLNGTYIIAYNDKAFSKEAGEIDTTIRISSKNEAVISRKGAYESRLHIKKGEKTACSYFTPYGTIIIDLLGEKIESSLKDDGGALSLKYRIGHNGFEVNKNEIEIIVKEV